MDFSVLRKASYFQKGSFAIKVLTTPGFSYVLCCTILRAKAVEMEAIHPNIIHWFAASRELIKTPHACMARSPFTVSVTVSFYLLDPWWLRALIKWSDGVQARWWTKTKAFESWLFWSRGNAMLSYHLVLYPRDGKTLKKKKKRSKSVWKRLRPGMKTIFIGSLASALKFSREWCIAISLDFTPIQFCSQIMTNNLLWV